MTHLNQSDLHPGQRAENAHSIARAAESRLRQTTYEALKRVTCDFQDGAIILRGVVPSFYLKQVAQIAVSNLVGVERIVNQIEVPPPNSDEVRRPR